MPENATTNGIFRTTDIVLTAWLLTRGATLVGTDDADPQHVKFLVRPHPSPDDIATFIAREALANVHAFYGAFRHCKRALNGGA